MTAETRRRWLASVSAGLLSGTTTFMGIITQMMSEGKTEFSDISELALVVLVVGVIMGAAKDVHSRNSESHYHLGSHND